MYTVCDLCGFLPVLLSTDDRKIIADAAKELLGPNTTVNFGRERWVAGGIRAFLEEDVEGVLPVKQLYVLAAQLRWIVHADVSRAGYPIMARLAADADAVQREISYGPWRLLDRHARLWLGSYTARKSELGVSLYLLPPPFCRACSDEGRILVASELITHDLRARVGSDFARDITATGSGRVFLLFDPERPDPDAVASAWAEACLLQEGM
jgi:hypothetical protein